MQGQLVHRSFEAEDEPAAVGVQSSPLACVVDRSQGVPERIDEALMGRDARDQHAGSTAQWQGCWYLDATDHVSLLPWGERSVRPDIGRNIAEHGDHCGSTVRCKYGCH